MSDLFFFKKDDEKMFYRLSSPIPAFACNVCKSLGLIVGENLHFASTTSFTNLVKECHSNGNFDTDKFKNVKLFFLHCKAMEEKIKENNIKLANLSLDFCSKHFLSKGILTHPPLKNLHHITSKIKRDKSIQDFMLKKIDVKMKAIKCICKSLGEMLNDRVIIFSIVSFLPSLNFFFDFRLFFVRSRQM